MKYASVKHNITDLEAPSLIKVINWNDCPETPEQNQILLNVSYVHMFYKSVFLKRTYQIDNYKKQTFCQFSHQQP